MHSAGSNRVIRFLLAAAVVSLIVAGRPARADTVTVGVLKFGTVNWELDVIKHHGLAEAEGVTLNILALASKNATTVALQAGSVDVIVSDWIWVSRQRAEGARYTFVPYSTALGALVVPAGSPIEGLSDLKGKRVGIAGGPLDKSWLLMRGLAAEQNRLDLDEAVDKVFAAPPLLNEQMRAKRLDAVLNFWHYAARLEAAGYRRVTGVTDVVRALGVATDVPMIGYVFDERWAEGRREDVLGFVRATRKAKTILAESDAEWDRIRPLMKAKDDRTFHALRDGYRRGVPKRWGKAERADAGRLFGILAKLGGEKLVGRSHMLQDGTFWPHVDY